MPPRLVGGTLEGTNGGVLFGPWAWAWHCIKRIEWPFVRNKSSRPQGGPPIWAKPYRVSWSSLKKSLRVWDEGAFWWENWIPLALPLRRKMALLFEKRHNFTLIVAKCVCLWGDTRWKACKMWTEHSQCSSANLPIGRSNPDCSHCSFAVLWKKIWEEN